MGLTDPSHVHFLNLPFYETGGVKKGLLTDKDIQIVVDLLREIKPHQIYAAGDLSDPHGTHRVCIEAVLAAMEVVQDEEWVKECRLWLYRGAWQEWDLDMVDMAVPLSPDEVIQKRHAIYRHLSQKDIVRSQARTSANSGNGPRNGTRTPPGCTTSSEWPNIKPSKCLSGYSDDPDKYRAEHCHE